MQVTSSTEFSVSHEKRTHVISKGLENLPSSMLFHVLGFEWDAGHALFNTCRSLRASIIQPMKQILARELPSLWQKIVVHPTTSQFASRDWDALFRLLVMQRIPFQRRSNYLRETGNITSLASEGRRTLLVETSQRIGYCLTVGNERLTSIRTLNNFSTGTILSNNRVLNLRNGVLTFLDKPAILRHRVQQVAALRNDQFAMLDSDRCVYVWNGGDSEPKCVLKNAVSITSFEGQLIASGTNSDVHWWMGDTHFQTSIAEHVRGSPELTLLSQNLDMHGLSAWADGRISVLYGRSIFRGFSSHSGEFLSTSPQDWLNRRILLQRPDGIYIAAYSNNQICFYSKEAKNREKIIHENPHVFSLRGSALFDGNFSLLAVDNMVLLISPDGRKKTLLANEPVHHLRNLDGCSFLTSTPFRSGYSRISIWSPDVDRLLANAQARNFSTPHTINPALRRLRGVSLAVVAATRLRLQVPDAVSRGE